MKRSIEVEEWFLVYAAYHKAVETYNNRVKFIRDQEKQGHVGKFNANGEYQLMNEAQKATYVANETLYFKLKEQKDV